MDEKCFGDWQLPERNYETGTHERNPPVGEEDFVTAKPLEVPLMAALLFCIQQDLHLQFLLLWLQQK
ncbi:hypothetical protein EK904_006382 [Melospiza melodia maxima]|nr:hypothetical protein EK904_006382 [Melospiza melodia maxima]